MSDHRQATSFLRDLKSRIAVLPRTEIEAWPNYPVIPVYPIEVPSELSSYTFTLMKDTFPDGRIRIAIQCYRHYFLGTGFMSADGFVSSPDGSCSDLTEQDFWDIT
jgi:hypothetical protein